MGPIKRKITEIQIDHHLKCYEHARQELIKITRNGNYKYPGVSINHCKRRFLASMAKEIISADILLRDAL